MLVRAAEDAVAFEPEVQHRRRRDRHLGDRFGVRMKKLEVVEKRMRGEIDFAGHAHAVGDGLRAVEAKIILELIALDAVEPEVEIIMPPLAAQLAVGRELEPDLRLLGDQRLDLAILDGLELLGGDLACLPLGARGFEFGRAQKTADVIGAKRSCGVLHDPRCLPGACRSTKIVVRGQANCTNNNSAAAAQLVRERGRF